MNDTSEQPAPRKGIPPWHWGVYLLLLATAIFAALLSHDTFIAPRRPPPPRQARRPTRRALPRAREGLWRRTEG